MLNNLTTTAQSSQFTTITLTKQSKLLKAKKISRAQFKSPEAPLRLGSHQFMMIQEDQQIVTSPKALDNTYDGIVFFAKRRGNGVPSHNSRPTENLPKIQQTIDVKTNKHENSLYETSQFLQVSNVKKQNGPSSNQGSTAKKYQGKISGSSAVSVSQNKITFKSPDGADVETTYSSKNSHPYNTTLSSTMKITLQSDTLQVPALGNQSDHQKRMSSTFKKASSIPYNQQQPLENGAGQFTQENVCSSGQAECQQEFELKSENLIEKIKRTTDASKRRIKFKSNIDVNCSIDGASSQVGGSHTSAATGTQASVCKPVRITLRNHRISDNATSGICLEGNSSSYSVNSSTLDLPISKVYHQAQLSNYQSQQTGDSILSTSEFQSATASAKIEKDQQFTTANNLSVKPTQKLSRSKFAASPARQEKKITESDEESLFDIDSPSKRVERQMTPIQQQVRTLEEAVLQDIFTPSAIKEPIYLTSPAISSSKQIMFPQSQNSKNRRLNSFKGRSAVKTNEISSDQLFQKVLNYHDISVQNRARILDWTVQVFRAFRLSSPQTFFTAVQIMDQYFVAKYQQNIRLGPQNLYIVGLTAVLISSKFEDVDPIRLQSLLDKAGHCRFTKEQILTIEMDMLAAIGFRVHKKSNLYLESEILFKNFLARNNLNNSDTIWEMGQQFLGFLAQFSVFSSELQSSKFESKTLALGVFDLTIKYMKVHLRSLLKSGNSQTTMRVSDLHRGYELLQSQKCNHFNEDIKEVEQQLMQLYEPAFNTPDGSLRNLEKSFPDFIGPDASPNTAKFIKKYQKIAQQ